MFALSLFSQAIREGRFSHGTFIEDELDELSRRHDWEREIPYGKGFAEYFAHLVASHGLSETVEFISRECECYERRYPAFFNATAGGYQHLSDVLEDARHNNTVPSTPSLERAIKWLTAQAAPGERLQHNLAPDRVPSASAQSREEESWAGIFGGEHIRFEVEEVLEMLCLVERDAHGKTVVTTESTPGGWVGAIEALQQTCYLTRNKSAVARVLRAYYGKPFSASALHTGLPPDNYAHTRAFNRTRTFLNQTKSGSKRD